jgi:hypothetical protein
MRGHKNMVKVSITSIETDNNMCTQTTVLNSYARYHNYTLKDAIACKLRCAKMFRDEDLLYMFIALSGVGSLLHMALEHNYIGAFKADRVYLSTEGYVKVYPFRLARPNTAVSQDETSNGSDLGVNMSFERVLERN